MREYNHALSLRYLVCNKHRHSSNSLDISKAMCGYDPFKASTISPTGNPGFMCVVFHGGEMIFY